MKIPRGKKAVNGREEVTYKKGKKGFFTMGLWTGGKTGGGEPERHSREWWVR